VRVAGVAKELKVPEPRRRYAERIPHAIQSLTAMCLTAGWRGAWMAGWPGRRHAVGLTLRTFQRWHRGETLKADARIGLEGRVYNPPNRLSQAERDAALALVNEPRFASSSPTRSWPSWPTRAATSPRSRPSLRAMEVRSTRRVVPGRRGRVRIAASVAGSEGPGAAEAICRAHPTRRRVIDSHLPRHRAGPAPGAGLGHHRRTTLIADIA